MELLLFVLVVCGLEMNGQVTCLRGVGNAPVPPLVCAAELIAKSLGALEGLRGEPIVAFQATCRPPDKPAGIEAGAKPRY